MANKKAPPGKVYQCRACGKRSTWLFGWDDKDLRVADKGYDVSCMMNAVLVDEEVAEENIRRIKEAQQKS